MTASDGGDMSWASPGTSYPEITVSLPLTHQAGALTCGMHGLDGTKPGSVPGTVVPDTVITTRYSHAED